VQPGTDLAGSAESKTAARYVIDAGRSSFNVQAFSTGLLSVLGHDPKIAVRDIQGEVQFIAAESTIEAPQVHVRMKASSLEVIDDISDKDRGEIHRQMYSEVLEVERYPDITYDCSRVTITGTGATFSATLNGDLTLHGETRALEVPVRVSMTGSILKASGQFSVSQRTFGIAPVSVAGGAIKLKDEIKCTFNIAARKQE
jgi:polyisoprenoid-binding protein YceI